MPPQVPPQNQQPVPATANPPTPAALPPKAPAPVSPAPVASAPAAAPAATSVPQIKMNPDGSYDRNIVNPEAFKSMVVKAYPTGVASDGTRYADMNANDLVAKMIAKYPHGVTQAGVPYVAYQDLGAAKGPTDTFAGHPILKGISDFLGTTNLGKGITQAIYLNLDPQGRQLVQDMKDGKISYEDLSNAVGGLVTPNQVAGSAMQTASDAIVPSGGGSFLEQALKWAGVGALSGAGSAVEQGQSPVGVAESALGTGVVSGLAAPALGKTAGWLGEKMTGALPEKLYSQFFKTTTDEFAKGINSEAGKVLQKQDPELFKALVDRGVFKVGEDGSIAVNKSAAQKAIEAGLMGSPKAMGAQLVAQNLQLSDAVDKAAAGAPPIKVNGQYAASLKQLLQTFYDRIDQAGGGIFANPLKEPLMEAIAKVDKAGQTGELATSDALQIRRMLDAMQKAKAYVSDANLSVSDSVLKNATNFLRRAVNAAPGMGDLMGKWSDNMAMLTDIQKRGAQLESAKTLNLFDLMAVTEGAQVFGEGANAVGKGITFDALMKFLTSATGGTTTGQGLYRLGQAAASPAGQKITGAAGAGAAEFGLNLMKNMLNAGSTSQ